MVSKRKYNKPLLEKYGVDRDISLIMMTSPPLDPPFITVEKGEGMGVPGAMKSPTEDSNPFGGSTPDYN